MGFREVSVVEVREVLRAWLEGVGLRPVAERAGVDRKTARRYVEAAQAAGLTRDAGLQAVTDELVGLVVEAVRPVRPHGHGAAWESAARTRGADPGLGHGPHDSGRRQARSVVDCEDRAAAGPAGGAGAVSDPAPLRCRAVRVRHGTRHHGPCRRRRSWGGVPARLRPDGSAGRPCDPAAAASAGVDLHRGAEPAHVRMVVVLPDPDHGDRGLRGRVGVLRWLLQGLDSRQPDTGRAEGRSARAEPEALGGLAGLCPARRVRHRPGEDPVGAGQGLGFTLHLRARVGWELGFAEGCPGVS